MLLHCTLQFNSGINYFISKIYMKVLFLFSMMSMAVFVMYMTIGYGERAGFSFGGDWFKAGFKPGFFFPNHLFFFLNFPYT